MKSGDEDRNKIITDEIQNIGIERFLELNQGDMLLIDSSHVVKTGSDVNHILFNILPSLKSNVYVHFHDIFYPFEYPTHWVYEGRAWNEARLPCGENGRQIAL